MSTSFDESITLCLDGWSGFDVSMMADGTTKVELPIALWVTPLDIRRHSFPYPLSQNFRG
jgi:hypothetical protein